MQFNEKVDKVLAGGNLPINKAKHLVKIASLKKASKMIFQEEVTSGGSTIKIALDVFRLALTQLGIKTENDKEVLQIALGVSRELYSRR